MDFASSQNDDSDKMGYTEIIKSRRLSELERFNNAMLNPSKELKDTNSVRT